MRLPVRAIAVASAAIAVTAAMGNAVRNGFVYDDVPIIHDNPAVTHPASWLAAFHGTYWHGTLWRPFTITGFAVQWWAGRGSAWLFHAVALAGYIALGWLLFELLTALEVRPAAACAAMLLFLVDPVHVEVVANVVGQGELWTALALLGATLLYVRQRATNRSSPATLFGIVLLTAAACTAKEEGFTAPLVLLGAELVLPVVVTRKWWRRFRTVGLTAAVTLILFLVRSNVTGSLGGETPASAFRHAGFTDRALTFLAVVPQYARLLVLPWHLQADYSPPQIPVGGPFTAIHLLGALILLGIAGLFWWTRRRTPVAAFGLWWAAVAIVPVANVLMPTGIVMAERVFFLPSAGFAITLAAVLNAIVVVAPGWKCWRNVGYGVAALWGLAAVIRSHQRVPVWRDQVTFFIQMPVDAPRSYRAWETAGKYWQSVAQSARAEQAYRTALRLRPADPETSDKLSQLLRAESRCDEAIPVLAPALQADPERATVRARLVECLIDQHQWDAAARYAKEGLALDETQFSTELKRVVDARDAQEHRPK